MPNLDKRFPRWLAIVVRRLLAPQHGAFFNLLLHSSTRHKPGPLAECYALPLNECRGWRG
jgi:hypothetical protein